MSTTTGTTTAPMPTSEVDSIITTVLGVLETSTILLRFVPGIPANVTNLVATAITDTQLLYTSYKANPNESLLTAIQNIFDQAIADVQIAITANSTTPTTATTTP